MDLQKHYQELTNALVHAFDDNQLRMLVTFRLSENLDHIVAAGPFRTRVFELIRWCDQEGKVDELFIAALQEKPGNPKLKALAGKIADEIAVSHQAIVASVLGFGDAYRDYESPHAAEIRNQLSDFQANGALQAVAVAAPHLKTGQDVVAWSASLARARSRICSIAGDLLGTGFLIGADIIMTNSHVIREGRLNNYDVVFDYVAGTNRNELPNYRIATELIRSQPREFDYVILKLDRVPEGNRGWFKARSHTFDLIREPISVLGHPNGDPLAISYGVVFDNNSFFGRVAYTANTAPGSSGSPVFTENWDLAAIHHHGEVNVNNHGIPLKTIAGHLIRQGMGQLLTVHAEV